MLTEEIRLLDAVFQGLVKRRRGTMVRRGGAGSRDFEVSLPFGGQEVLVGVESGWTAEDALFLFIRHARSRATVVDAHPFLPPRPAGVPEVVGRAELPDDPQKGPGGRAGGHGTATPSAPAGTHDTPATPALPARPGFSVSLREMTLPERIFHRVVGRQVRADPKRPGWFHVELDSDDVLSNALQPGLRNPLAQLISGRPLAHLSIAMTPQFYRIRRSPVLFGLEELDAFITRALELFTTAIALPPAAAAEVPGLFLVDMLYATGRGARCGVCGEEAASRRVLCGKCATPHHEECWSYSGGCSVFGCGCTTRAIT